jgi:hypothetical protein
MNLLFPTQLQFPTYPTRPTEEDEAGLSAFFEALRSFFQHVVQQHTATSRYFDAADCYFENGNQESLVTAKSTDVSEQAIAAVIKNITQPTKGEYVWDAAQNCWKLKLTPI